MRPTLRTLVLFAICLVAKQAAAQSRLPALSLCDLQMRSQRLETAGASKSREFI